ncbi:MAG: hypothetical protein ABIW38_07240 [Ferruginibacter sp.]
MRKIFIYCMIFVMKSASAQYSAPKAFTAKDLRTGPFRTAVQLNPHQTFLTLLQPDYFLHNESFFCRQERKLENATKLPFRFRVGSLQYCNWLEGKPNALMPR